MDSPPKRADMLVHEREPYNAEPSRGVLADDVSPWAWRFWHAEIHVPAARTTITARAWDSSAALQPEHPASVWNPMGYINNSWPTVTVTGR